MKKEDLIRLGKETLPLILDKNGEIIYSSHETLKKGDVYFLGLNPGGGGGTKIKEHLEGMLNKKTNSYIDELWDDRGRVEIPKGQANLQIRVKYLLSKLNFDTENVCASNLIFTTSRDIDSLEYGELSNFNGLASYCWEYHKIILEIIQPKIILCFGNGDKSPYTFIHSIYGGEEKKICAKHKNWKCKAFNTIIQGRNTNVVSVPHLSRYDIREKIDVIDWIKKFLK